MALDFNDLFLENKPETDKTAAQTRESSRIEEQSMIKEGHDEIQQMINDIAFIDEKRRAFDNIVPAQQEIS
jgi:hypothetical protein